MIVLCEGKDGVEMESPPSFSGHSEAPPLSEDSGLLITSGSVSSDSVSGWLHITSEVNYCLIISLITFSIYIMKPQVNNVLLFVFLVARK